MPYSNHSSDKIKKSFMLFRAARPEFFTGSIIPVILGTVLAVYNNAEFSMHFFIAALTGTLFIHAGLDYINDYYDHKSGTDALNMHHNRFSGGSRYIQNGILKPRTVLLSGLVCFAAGGTIGIYLNSLLPGNFIVFLGTAGVFLAFFYSAAPLSLASSGIGEISTAAGFGPLIIAGSYYVQAGNIRLLPILASVPVAVLIGLVLFLNEFPDHDSDKTSGKKTLVVRLGRKNSMKIYSIFLAVPYLWIAGGILLGIFPLPAVLTFLTVPIALRAFVITRKHHHDPVKILPANALTVILHISAGLVFTAGFIIKIPKF